MSMVQGSVQAVSSKQQVFNTVHGPRYNLQFKMPDGNWYRYPFCKPEQAPPVMQGMMVEFDYTIEQNGQYQNIIVDKTSFKSVPSNAGYGAPVQQQSVQQMQPQPTPQQQIPVQQPQQPMQPKRNSSGNPGMAVGMAMNCASRLMAAEGWQDGTNAVARLEQIASEVLMAADRLVERVEAEKLYIQQEVCTQGQQSECTQPQPVSPQQLEQQAEANNNPDQGQTYQTPQGFSDDVPQQPTQNFAGTGQPQS